MNTFLNVSLLMELPIGTDVMKETMDNWDDLVADCHGYHSSSLKAFTY